MSPSILIAEQDLIRSALLQRLLTSLGFVVSAVDGLDTALDVATEYNLFDFVLLGLRQPRGDTRDLCTALRLRGCRAHVVIISDAVTGDEIAESLRAGADCHVVFPAWASGLTSFLAAYGSALRPGTPQSSDCRNSLAA